MSPQMLEKNPTERSSTHCSSHDAANGHPLSNEAEPANQPDLENSPKPQGPPAGGPPPPPNGGLIAWLQVASGFVLFFNTWGMISSFSVFQTYYESGELFHASSSSISWIGSIQSFLLQLTGLVAGPLYDRGYLRALLVTGSFLIVFGLTMLSLCTQYWQALLAQGFCIGIGAGLLFVPTVSLIPFWFSTRIGLAIGIASSGSSLGGVIYPVVLYRLISQVGFPWAVRCLGFIALATFTVPLAAMRVRFRMPKLRAVVDWTAFREPPFVLFTLSVLLVFISNTVIIFYVSYYPTDRGFTDTSLGFYITAIFNAGSVVGRILPNALSDRIGVFNTMAPLTVLSGIVILCLLGVTNTAGMIVEAIVTGFFSGVVIALPPVCFRVLTKNKAMIGTRVGQGFAIAGVGLLLAGPSAGAILGGTQPLNWTGVWVFGGVTAVASGLLVAVVRVITAGAALKKKA
jgi:MFS family permease